MAITINNTFLTVHDKDIALTFYRDALGLELVGDVEKGRILLGHAHAAGSARRQHRAVRSLRRPI